MTTVIIRRNVLDASKDETYHVEEVGTFLYEYFDTWPKTAKIYQEIVNSEMEVKLETREDVLNLNCLSGTVIVVIYPAFMALLGIGLIVATVIINLATRKKKKKAPQIADNQETPQGSPNNTLNARSNRERINERIPDIYGTVRSIPDLLSESYAVYEGNTKIEYSLMGVSRGDCHLTDIREDDTLLETVGGNDIEVWGPNTSPNSGEPKSIIGSRIAEPFIFTKRITGVDNQKLESDSAKFFTSTWQFSTAKAKLAGNTIAIIGIDTIPYAAGNGINIFAWEKFKAGDTGRFNFNNIGTVRNFKFAFNQIATLNPDGTIATFNVVRTTNNITEITYKIVKVDDIYCYLQVNFEDGAIWEEIKNLIDTDGVPTTGMTNFTGQIGKYVSARVQVEQISVPGVWTDYNSTLTNFQQAVSGPFEIDDAEGVILNFNAPDGLYTDDGTTQLARNINLEVTIRQLDANSDPVGSPVVTNIAMNGSSTKKEFIGRSFRIVPGFTGKMDVAVRRTTNENPDFDGTIAETINWEDAYGYKTITENHFGDITMVRTAVRASGQNLLIQSRKFNCLASRLIPSRNNDGTWSLPTVTSRFTDILRAVSIDPKIGNLSENDLDIEQWFDTYDDIVSYFGSTKAAEFNYTFDDANLSYEEIASIICEAAFCNVYRQGRQIKIFFEKIANTSTLLFNHRNKLPRTETRNVIFGFIDQKDGVDLEWTDRSKGEPVNFYIPSDQSAVNPEDIKQLGVVHKLQAYFHAWRAYQKQRYQNVAVEFDATQEALMLNLGQRIQIADNTRTKTFDGEILSQTTVGSDTVLTLSQPFEFEDGKSYTIFLQHIDATIQSVGISPGEFNNEVILNAPLTGVLSLDENNFARTTYEIVENDSPRKLAFLVEEKTPKEGMVVSVRAVNYDSRYYDKDKDLINAIIDENGNPV